MSSYTNLQDQLNSFQHGLFFNLSNKEWKLPNGIARMLEADDSGCCWFLFHLPGDEAALYETEFPARVRLYEKGRDRYIEASGKAEMVLDPQEWTACAKISGGMAKALRYHGLVVRFRILHATVIEAGKHSGKNIFRRMADELMQWLMGRTLGETTYPASVVSH